MKRIRSDFNSRQYMLAEDFELYYYSDVNFQNVGSHSHAYYEVYLFSEGNANMRELLGGKGANLAEMTNIGLPVPQGFTITTEACTQYYEDGRRINDDIQAEIMATIPKLEEITGKKF